MRERSDAHPFRTTVSEVPYTFLAFDDHPDSIEKRYILVSLALAVQPSHPSTADGEAEECTCAQYQTDS